MKLYHYSAVPLKELLTKRAQGNLTDEDIKKSDTLSKRLGTIAPYIDHISFFFDPLPLTLIAEIFKPTAKHKEPHSVWVKGKVLYEHVIETEVLGDGCSWEIVESLKKIAFYDQFVEEHNWVEDDPAKLKLYLEEEKKNAVLWGERGHGLKGLDKQIRLNQGVTEKAYQAAAKRDDFEYNRMKYAACVPHLMLYPEGGRVPVNYINQVTVGSPARKRI